MPQKERQRLVYKSQFSPPTQWPKFEGRVCEAILLHVREIPGSNPEPHVSYSRGFCWFSTGSSGKFRDRMSN